MDNKENFQKWWDDSPQLKKIDSSTLTKENLIKLLESAYCGGAYDHLLYISNTYYLSEIKG